MQDTQTLAVPDAGNLDAGRGVEISTSPADLLVGSLTTSLLAMVRIACRAASSILLASGFAASQVQAFGLPRIWPGNFSSRSADVEDAGAEDAAGVGTQKLIVIGFMGGNVRPNNFVHREAKLTETLQMVYPKTIHAEIFANRNGVRAYEAVLRLLGKRGDKPLSDQARNSARIVIFGHSWGASETVALAKRLNKAGVPVLLTIQVDSVQKQRQNDAEIPPNVREAVNFYQADGMLRGRDQIVAADPEKTAILGNYLSSYRRNPVSCAGFPWYARAFMKPHVQIENDPVIWNHIQDLIVAKTF